MKRRCGIVPNFGIFLGKLQADSQKNKINILSDQFPTTLPQPRLLRPGSIVIYYHISTGDTGSAPPEQTARRLQTRLKDYFTSPAGRQFHGTRFPVSQISIERERNRRVASPMIGGPVMDPAEQCKSLSDDIFLTIINFSA